MWHILFLFSICSVQLQMCGGVEYQKNSTLHKDKKLETGHSESVLHRRHDLLFFNRVPKVGSQMMMTLLRKLSVRNKFDFHHDGAHKFLSLKLNRKEEKKLAQLLELIPTPAAYTKHVPFVNFTRSHLRPPTYINMVRHPVERVISWFYYLRIPAVQEQHKVLNPGRNVSKTWLKKDFESCVLNKDKECQFLAGDELQKNGNAWSQMLFYCGMGKKCSEPDGSWALARAKLNVEKAYSVVGVLEELPSTLRVFEAKVPRFFTGATQVYEKNKKQLSTKNQNPDKPKVSDKVKEIIRQGFPNEIEFYEFCKARLYHQDLRHETILD